MKQILAKLSLRQRISIALVAVSVAAGLYALVRHQKEADFKPLFTDVGPEDAAAVVQKLKEGGVEYRLSGNGGSILAPSARIAELRLSMAAAGLPKTGRIGFELFDKTNLGATEFTEHINYRRALEGELERSVMSLAEVEQARVHLTFPKDSVFLDSQQPAKASVMVKLRQGAHLAPQNVVAIDHLVASAVEGLAPEAVSVLDMNGNLLGRPKPPGQPDNPEPSETLDYRRKLESDLLTKVNSTLEPLLGANKFRAGVSIECDFSAGEQSEEIYDPARSVMTRSERTEDASAPVASNGVPGTPSTLPRPVSRPASGAGRISRVTENISYQSSRTMKKTHLPVGNIRKMSLAVLVDQAVTWERDGNGYKRVLAPPSAEKLKIIHDLVAGIAGASTDRGDQVVVETLPFETTLLLEPPPLPPTPGAPTKGGKPQSGFAFQWNRQTQLIAAGVGAGLIVLTVAAVLLIRRRRKNKKKKADATAPAAIVQGQSPAQPGAPELPSTTDEKARIEKKLEEKLAEHEAAIQQAEAQALNSLKLAPVITKAAEVMAKHLREKISHDPELAAQVLRTWIREEES